VRAVLLVLRKHLEDVLIDKEVVRNAYGERPRVHLRIVEGHLQIEMTEIARAEPLSHAQLIAVRVAHAVERRLWDAATVAGLAGRVNACQHAR
jgi:hypothetical protein